MAFGYFLFRRLLFDLMDEVYDSGDALVVRNNDQEDRIALTNITNVSYSQFVNPPRVTLSLREKCRFGDQVTFSPPTYLKFDLFAPNPMIEDLIKRIEAARTT